MYIYMYCLGFNEKRKYFKMNRSANESEFYIFLPHLPLGRPNKQVDVKWCYFFFFCS